MTHRHPTKELRFKMAVYDVTIIPGDGIGPEVAEATRRVLEATGVKFNWDVQRYRH